MKRRGHDDEEQQGGEKLRRQGGEELKREGGESNVDTDKFKEDGSENNEDKNDDDRLKVIMFVGRHTHNTSVSIRLGAWYVVRGVWYSTEMESIEPFCCRFLLGHSRELRPCPCAQHVNAVGQSADYGDSGPPPQPENVAQTVSQRDLARVVGGSHQSIDPELNSSGLRQPRMEIDVAFT